MFVTVPLFQSMTSYYKWELLCFSIDWKKYFLSHSILSYSARPRITAISRTHQTQHRCRDTRRTRVSKPLFSPVAIPGTTPLLNQGLFTQVAIPGPIPLLNQGLFILAAIPGPIPLLNQGLFTPVAIPGTTPLLNQGLFTQVAIPGTTPLRNQVCNGYFPFKQFIL